MRFRLLGDVDAHHGQARFRWALAPVDSEPVVIGFDVVTVNDDGLITTVLGFLDRAPGLNDEVEPARTYAVAHLHDVRMGDGIVGYLNGIDDTLRPFGGKFIIHGGRPTVLEGEWTGDLIVLEFPDRASAEGWYRSDAYQRILPLRTDNAAGTAFLIDGVDDAHAATDILR
ncbi:DUF1330 domain-containing protein [Phytoactinopolyspora alkaliphila]|uniref:DUF1330 domain-containing protein n=1 Tax=Phytoactinopolyspora alkaliphila TaxID=1783498 RepID=A0A6N9YIL5_9ACTN|nr:DUF1330 domain-containing protein [Phytoactinopolyspora alkaliphila]